MRSNPLSKILLVKPESKVLLSPQIFYMNENLLRPVFLGLGDTFAYTGPDRNWETRRAAEKGGGTGTCSSWFGVSTLFTNAKGAFSFLFSQVANFR